MSLQVGQKQNPFTLKPVYSTALNDSHNLLDMVLKI